MTEMTTSPGYLCTEGAGRGSHRIVFESVWVVHIDGSPYRVAPGFSDLTLLKAQNFDLHGWRVYVNDPTQTTVSRGWVAQAGLSIRPPGPTPGTLPETLAEEWGDRR